MPLFLIPCLDEASLRPKGKTCLYIMETDAFILEDDNLSWLWKISSHWSYWEWTQMLCIMVFKVTLLIRVAIQHSFSRHEKYWVGNMLLHAVKFWVLAWFMKVARFFFVREDEKEREFHWMLYHSFQFCSGYPAMKAVLITGGLKLQV